MIRVVSDGPETADPESSRVSPRGYTVTSMEQPQGSAGRALVVVVDDRQARGVAEAHSGALVTELLTEAGFVVDGVVVVSADEVEIRNALNTAVIGGVDLVVSVGGTGVSPRDVTPEATIALLDRELLGIAEALRTSGLAAGSTDAGLSRGLAGISGSTLVVNLAGSRAAVRDGMATLGPQRLQGAVESRGQALAWDLAFEGDAAPVLLLPFKLYKGGFPAAKSLVSLPLARFKGELSVNGEAIDVADWIGSQNHNWGSRHTDLYAWGQVAGFDTHPESFLEIATARLRIGPFWTPPLTPLVLRHRQKEYALTGLLQGIRARGSFGYFNWEFRSETAEVVIEGVISAPRRAFVGLEYRNPPGGVKHCLNSKIAACTLDFRDKRTGSSEILETKSRAAFEILTSDPNHGVAISA